MPTYILDEGKPGVVIAMTKDPDGDITIKANGHPILVLGMDGWVYRMRHVPEELGYITDKTGRIKVWPKEQ